MTECSVSRLYHKHHTSTQTTPTNTAHSMNQTTVSSNDTTCTGRKRRGWPGGRHASPTELKMRSGITTISVNFPTFPANQSFRPTAESMRPRAKSFIRPISQIEANRQKFSLSMTSEVRKCPKSVESDRNSGFLHLDIERQGCIRCDVKTKDAHARCGSTVEIFFTQLGDLTFIFEKNRFFFSLFNFLT